MRVSRKKRVKLRSKRLLPSRKSLVRALDKAVSEYIRARDGKCVVCGSREHLQNGHLFTRVNYSTRWDIGPDGNCRAQCRSCNMRHEYDPYPYMIWYIKTHGQESLDALHLRHNRVTKFSDSQLAEMLAEVKRIPADDVSKMYVIKEQK
jgi:hypothetical protein